MSTAEAPSEATLAMASAAWLKGGLTKLCSLTQRCRQASTASMPGHAAAALKRGSCAFSADAKRSIVKGPDHAFNTRRPERRGRHADESLARDSLSVWAFATVESH